MTNEVVRKEPSDVTTLERTESRPLFTPRVDIFENDDELVLLADLPGVQPDDLDVRFENGELVLHGRVTPRYPNASGGAWEYGVGDFYRAFTISEVIDHGRISAELKNGVLTVHLPKSEAAKPKRIAVKCE